MTRFFKHRNVSDAEKALYQAARAVSILRGRVTKEATDALSVFNLISLMAAYVRARDLNDDAGRKKALKKINHWTASFEGDSRALARYYNEMEYAESWLLDNGVSAGRIAHVRSTGYSDGDDECVKRGYYGKKS